MVVSRNGRGDVWLFADVREARLHPIPQLDDVYAESPEALVGQYGRDEVNDLLRFAEGRDRSTLISAFEEWRRARSGESLLVTARQLLWDKVRSAGRRPPKDPAEVVRIVIEDRTAREGRVLRSIPDVAVRSEVLTFKPNRTRGDASVDTEECDEMGEKRDVFRMGDNDTISYGKDADGKQYSADHTPKRGDNTKALWGKYRDGMTVKEALDAGLSRSNIRRDRRAGNIVITKAPEPEKDEAADEAA